MPKTQGFSITCRGAEAEVILYDEIDPHVGVSAKGFRDQLQALGNVKTIHLRINSPGGSVFDGLAIYNTLKDHPAKVVVHIDGMALSMASAVAMAGDQIEMADNAFMMIHNPVNLTVGDADAMRHMADLLDKVTSQLVNLYAARSRQTPEKVSSLMDAETWLTAEEAVSLGFADRRTNAVALAASFDASRFSHVPARFMQNTGQRSERERLIELQAALPNASADFILDCLRRCDSVQAAQAAYVRVQAAELKAMKQAEEERKAAEAEAAKRYHPRSEPREHAAPGVPKKIVAHPS